MVLCHGVCGGQTVTQLDELACGINVVARVTSCYTLTFFHNVPAKMKLCHCLNILSDVSLTEIVGCGGEDLDEGIHECQVSVGNKHVWRAWQYLG
jgi:hypothetical protein